MIIKHIPYYRQIKSYYCAPASLQMVFDYFSHFHSQKSLAQEMKTNSVDGTENRRMIQIATKHGFYCYVNDNSSFQEIARFLRQKLPVIVNFIEPSDNEPHYAVVSGLTPWRVILNDPWNGRNTKIWLREFKSRWHNQKNNHREWMMVLSKEDLGLGKQYSPKNNL